MKAPSSMKYSVAAAMLILVVGAGVGWNDRQQLARVKRDIETGTPGHQTVGGGGVSDLTKHARVEQPAVPDVDMANVIAVAAESDSSKAAGKQKDEAAKKRDSELIDHIRSLSLRQLRIFIAQVNECPELGLDNQRWYLSLGIRTFSDRDLGGALLLVEEFYPLLADSQIGAGLISSLMESRAKADPLAAVEWLRKFTADHPGIPSGPVNYRIIVTAATNDPKLAFKLVKDLMDAGGHDSVKSVLRDIVGAAKTDEERLTSLSALREYLQSVANPKQRLELQDSTIRRMTREVGTGGFDSAGKWLERANLSHEELWSFACGLSEDFTKNDTGRWIHWLGENFPMQSLPEADARAWGDQVRYLFRDWAEKDSTSASKWLEGLPQSDVRDYSVCAFARTLARDYPDTAAQWVKTLPSEENRDFMMNEIYEELMSNDPGAAAAFAKRNGIK